MNATTIRINEDSLYDAVVEYLTLIDTTQSHIHLRIDGLGMAYVSRESSYCISDGEFNKIHGHTITVKHQAGNGQGNLADDWMDTDEGTEAIQLLQDAIVEDLQRAGYDVEFFIA